MLGNVGKDRKETKAGVVARGICGDILAFRYQPGTEIREQTLAPRFGCSRTPVREAFSRLIEAGLLEKRKASTSVVVVPVGRAGLETLLEALAEPVGACARYAARRMSAEQLAEQRRLAERAIGDSDGSVQEPRPGGSEWLSAVIRGSGNPVLAGLANNLHQRALVYWWIIRENAPEHLTALRSSRLGVAGTLESFDPVAAEAAIRAYFDHVKVAAMAALQRYGS